jgi:hypothetical protein
MSKASKAKTSKIEAPKTKAAGIVDAAIQVGDDKVEIKRLAGLSPSNTSESERLPRRSSASSAWPYWII